MSLKHEDTLCDFWEIVQAEIAIYVRRNVAQDDADELMQEIFIVTLEKFNQFVKSDSKREKGILDFKRWTYQIAKNKIYNYRRKTARNSHADISLVGNIISDPADEIENAINDVVFLKIISCLDVKDRDLIIARLVDDLSFKDISERTGVNISTLKTRYRRSIKRLQKKFTKY